MTNVLGGKGLVVHEEDIDVSSVVDEEGLVARGHHVASFFVRSIANLEESSVSFALGASVLDFRFFADGDNGEDVGNVGNELDFSSVSFSPVVLMNLDNSRLISIIF